MITGDEKLFSLAAHQSIFFLTILYGRWRTRQPAISFVVPVGLLAFFPSGVLFLFCFFSTGSSPLLHTLASASPVLLSHCGLHTCCVCTCVFILPFRRPSRGVDSYLSLPLPCRLKFPPYSRRRSRVVLRVRIDTRSFDVSSRHESGERVSFSRWHAVGRRPVIQTTWWRRRRRQRQNPAIPSTTQKPPTGSTWLLNYQKGKLTDPGSQITRVQK